jgi:hypothetical protein
MMIRNIKLTVDKSSNDKETILTTELGQRVTINADLTEGLQPGQTLYLCADQQPITVSEQLAKDVLNELINE